MCSESLQTVSMPRVCYSLTHPLTNPLTNPLTHPLTLHRVAHLLSDVVLGRLSVGRPGRSRNPCPWPDTHWVRRTHTHWVHPWPDTHWVHPWPDTHWVRRTHTLNLNLTPPSGTRSGCERGTNPTPNSKPHPNPKPRPNHRAHKHMHTPCT